MKVTKLVDLDDHIDDHLVVVVIRYGLRTMGIIPMEELKLSLGSSNKSLRDIAIATDRYFYGNDLNLARWHIEGFNDLKTGDVIDIPEETLKALDILLKDHDRFREYCNNYHSDEE